LSYVVHCAASCFLFLFPRRPAIAFSFSIFYLKVRLHETQTLFHVSDFVSYDHNLRISILCLTTEFCVARPNFVSRDHYLRVSICVARPNFVSYDQFFVVRSNFVSFVNRP
jgi:hypothetical protein